MKKKNPYHYFMFAGTKKMQYCAILLMEGLTWVSRLFTCALLFLRPKESNKMKPKIFEQACGTLVHKILHWNAVTLYWHLHALRKQQKQLCVTSGILRFLKSFILILVNHHAFFTPWKKLGQNNYSNKNVISKTRRIRARFIAHISKKVRRL